MFPTERAAFHRVSELAFLSARLLFSESCKRGASSVTGLRLRHKLQ